MTMSQDRYPKDLILTVEDFTSCGLKAVLAGATGKDYPSMSDAFVDSVKQAKAKTMTLDNHGVKTEISPRSLMSPPEAKKLVGRDLSFESAEQGQEA